MQPILLDRNENHYGPPPECIQILRDLGPELLFNYTRDFKKGYYSALSRRLAEIHDVDEKRIVLGYGCEDILKQAVHHWLRSGERCFVPSASWWYYGAIAEEVDGITVQYPMIGGETTYRYGIEELKELHDEHRARVLLISSPNNPTGNVFPRERLPELLDHFRDAMVVLDEAYWGLNDDATEDTDRLVGDFPNIIILRTFSKLYGMAGARIGYGIAGAGLTSFLKFSARYLGYNRVSEKLALAALANTEYYRDIRDKMAADRKRFYETLRAYDGVRAYESYANFLLARFPERIVPALKTALDQRGLIIKFFTSGEFANSTRITLGTQEENSMLIEAFNELLPKLL